MVRQVLRHETLAMSLRYAHLAKPDVFRVGSILSLPRVLSLSTWAGCADNLPASSRSFGRTVFPNNRKRMGMSSPRTQNPVQFWQLRKRLTVDQAAHRIGIHVERDRTVVVRGDSRFTEDEISHVLAATGIAEDRLRAWAKRPKGDRGCFPAVRSHGLALF